MELMIAIGISIGLLIGIICLIVDKERKDNLSKWFLIMGGIALTFLLTLLIYNTRPSPYIPWHVSNTESSVSITSPTAYGVPSIIYTRGITGEKLTIRYSEPLEPKGYKLLLCPLAINDCMTYTNINNVRRDSFFTLTEANDSIKHSDTDFHLISGMVESSELGIAVEYIDGKSFQWTIDLTGFVEAYTRIRDSL